MKKGRICTIIASKVCGWNSFYSWMRIFHVVWNENGQLRLVWGRLAFSIVLLFFRVTCINILYPPKTMARRLLLPFPRKKEHKSQFSLELHFSCYKAFFSPPVVWWHVLVIFPLNYCTNFPCSVSLEKAPNDCLYGIPNTADAVNHQKIKKREQIFSWKPLPPNNGLCCYGFFLKNMVCESFKHHRRLSGIQQCI